jgi:hypothetical protein
VKSKNVGNLSALEDEIKELRNMISSSKRHEYQAISKLLFRGHANAEWELQTTLERYSNETFSVNSYNALLSSIQPAVSAYTAKEWLLDEKVKNGDDYFLYPPNYEFMSYIRHHGFPSPLLDWTQSLYIALFFAFQSCSEKNDVAIFTYIESLDGGKSGWVGAPTICLLGPYINTHKRHFIQQGQYTVSVKKDSDQWFYCRHDASLTESSGLDQDIVYKFILPGSLKFEIISKLNEMNLNPFTLFSTEESLMETLAFKEIKLNL